MSDTVKRDGNGGRDASGHFAPGNPGGGRPALPEWFKSKRESFLRMQCDVVETGKLKNTDGTEEAVDLEMRLKTLESLVMRGYGRPSQSAEDADAAAAAWDVLLAKLRAGEPPK